MEEKNQPQPGEEGSLLGGEPADPQPTPIPDPENAPSQEQQDLLREQQRQNTIERNEQRGADDRVEPEGGRQLSQAVVTGQERDPAHAAQDAARSG